MMARQGEHPWRKTRSAVPASAAKSKAVPMVNSGEEAVLFWCKALKLPLPTRNYRFHATRRFEIDWAWVEQKVGIEVDGGIFTRGAHARPMNILRDMAKHNLLLDAGWRVWRFTPSEAVSGIAVQHLEKILK